jgi:hypothetical protein
MEGRGGRGAAATSGRGEREWVLGLREGRCLNTEACSWAGSAVEMGRGGIHGPVVGLAGNNSYLPCARGPWRTTKIFSIYVNFNLMVRVNVLKY